MTVKRAPNSAVASKNITKRIDELGDWRGETLARVRRLIHEADPEIQEEWKWMGTPVWSHDGGVCTRESYKQVVKLTFFRGASLDDPKKLFNSSLEGNTRRALRDPCCGRVRRKLHGRTMPDLTEEQRLGFLAAQDLDTGKAPPCRHRAGWRNEESEGT